MTAPSIRGGHVAILACLARREGSMPNTEIARAVGRHTRSSWAALQTMHRYGWVKRRAPHRWAITEKGAKVYADTKDRPVTGIPGDRPGRAILTTLADGGVWDEEALAEEVGYNVTSRLEVFRHLGMTELTGEGWRSTRMGDAQAVVFQMMEKRR